MIHVPHRLAIATVASLVAISATALAAPSPNVPPAPPSSSGSIYRFDVSITGVDPSAPPAAYSLILRENQPGSLSVGANIPLTVPGPNQTSPMRQDTGLKMTFDYSLRGAVVVLGGDVEFTSADPATPASSATVHRIRAASVVPITVGTPALFCSLYDITSRRLYEVTVTARRLL